MVMATDHNAVCMKTRVPRTGGQTLVRSKMRNLLTRTVSDKTFKAAEKFKEPDLESIGRRSSTSMPTPATSWTRARSRP
jgi:translation elongation factor P/translation initiation factor 5A